MELTTEQLAGLKKLQEPFKDSEIGKLPKPTKQQNEAVKADYKKGIRCSLCGGWHHKDVVHLDYVGHAALTKRLLEVDPAWNWEPVATNEDGTPKLDKDGGMWGRLTVCGITRLGYGDSGGKSGPNATKEVIGDFCRNAAMRFGAAIDLWSKEDLTHTDEENQPKDQQEYQSKNQTESQGKWQQKKKATVESIKEYIDNFCAIDKETGTTAGTPKSLEANWKKYVEPLLSEYTEAEQKDITLTYNDTMSLLKEATK
jgi:hypothetical protein